MKFPSPLVTLTFCVIPVIQAHAVNILTIDVRNTFIAANNAITDENGSPLTGGDLLQLGYFDAMVPTSDGAVTFDNFVPLTDTSGDIATTLGFSSSGTFSGQVELNQDLNAPDAASTTLQFGLRFYNAASIADSTFFNTVTNNQWTFTFLDENTSPAPLPSLIDISGFTLNSQDAISSAVWQGSRDFSTTLPNVVPEPSSTLTVLLGAGLLLGSRRRK